MFGAYGRLAFFAMMAIDPVHLFSDSPQTQSEFWPELDGYIGINEHTRVFLQYTATREKDLKDYADGQLGGFLDFYMGRGARPELRDHPDASRIHYLFFRAGYSYSRSPAAGHSTASIDNIITLEATVQAPLGLGIILSDRNRGDLRFENDSFTPRYRNRLRLDRTFRTRRPLTPYLETEWFYDCRYDAFDEVRYSAGAEWAATRFLVAEAYYARQHDTKSSPEFVNALGIKIAFYLRVRPK